MQAVSSSEDGGGGRRASRAGKAKLSVRDLMSDDFKKAWLSLKDIRDKELHRLQMKLGSMRKARLTEGRRHGPVAKNKRVTETQNVPDSELCERCLINETYSNMLQQEFSNVHQKHLVQIAELTVENNKLKEENRKLSDKVKAKRPRIPLCFLDSDDDDFMPGIEFERRQVYNVKEPSYPVQLPARRVMEPRREQTRSLSILDVEPSPDDHLILLSSQEATIQVPETPLVDSASVKDNLAKEANVLPSRIAYSLPTTLETPKKDTVICISSQKSSTQKQGKDTLISSISSISPGEPIIISEASEQNMPCNFSKVLPPLTKKNELNSTRFPMNYSSKYSPQKKSPLHGFSYKNDNSVKSSSAPLPSKGNESASQSKNVKTCEKKPESNSEGVPMVSVLKRRITK